MRLGHLQGRKEGEKVERREEGGKDLENRRGRKDGTKEKGPIKKRMRGMIK